MPIPRAYCPVEGCDYWICFSGYFESFIKELYKHYASHKELSFFALRRPGGSARCGGKPTIQRLLVRG